MRLRESQSFLPAHGVSSGAGGRAGLCSITVAGAVISSSKSPEAWTHRACRYMAPEVLSCEVVPASDVWAAGVMAYQLLSGSLPFNDHAHPDEPALSLIW